MLTMLYNTCIILSDIQLTIKKKGKKNFANIKLNMTNKIKIHHKYQKR